MGNETTRPIDHRCQEGTGTATKTKNQSSCTAIEQHAFIPTACTSCAPSPHNPPWWAPASAVWGYLEVEGCGSPEATRAARACAVWVSGRKIGSESTWCTHRTVASTGQAVLPREALLLHWACRARWTAVTATAHSSPAQQESMGNVAGKPHAVYIHTEVGDEVHPLCHMALTQHYRLRCSWDGWLQERIRIGRGHTAHYTTPCRVPRNLHTIPLDKAYKMESRSC